MKDYTIAKPRTILIIGASANEHANDGLGSMLCYELCR